MMPGHAQLVLVRGLLPSSPAIPRISPSATEKETCRALRGPRVRPHQSCGRPPVPQWVQNGALLGLSHYHLECSPLGKLHGIEGLTPHRCGEATTTQIAPQSNGPKTYSRLACQKLF